MKHRPLLTSLTTALLAAVFVAAVATDAWSVTLYSVRPKDSLARIARAHGVSVERIMRANPELGRNMNLKIGQILIVPEPDEFVERNDEEEPGPTSVVMRSATPPTPPAPRVAVVDTPAPAPTPMATTDEPETGTFENLAVINRQEVEMARVYTEQHQPRHAPLASRRGRLLSQITTTARRFIGVPYVWGGTSPRGLDCSGFTMRVYRMAGVNIKRLADEQYYQGKPVKDPLPGDLVFFTTYLPGPSHVGIYLGGNLFIHASSRKGVTISSLGDPYFKKRYLGARSFF